MHQTETIDYAIVLSGEITMLLDESEVVLRAGDILVQCGTNHAWSNRSKEPAVVAFVLIDGQFDPVLKKLIHDET
jgi:quercetin dioxygenase-like cupin family protein